MNDQVDVDTESARTSFCLLALLLTRRSTFGQRITSLLSEEIECDVPLVFVLI